MSNSDITSDDALIEGCIKGNRKIQEELYRKYAKQMYQICLTYEPDKECAKDILQEAFVKVFRNILTHDKQSSLQGWIRKIITNTAIDHFRKVKISEKRFINLEVIKKEDEPYAPEHSHSLESEDILNRIKQLPNGARLVFNLYSLEGYSHREISEKLGISEGTSKSQLSRAKQLLQEWLEDYK